MMDEEIRQALTEVQEMKKMCGNINMKLTNIVTQRGQDWKKKLEAEYQRGFEDGKAVSDKGCDGCKYERENKMKAPCILCSNNFKNLWQAKIDDEIKVGDEVERSVYGRTEGKGIYLEDADEEGDWLKCLFWTGATFTVLAYPKEQFKKTGRHFDIASILKEMQS